MDHKDPVSLEIIQSSLQAISDEMFAAMRKTAMSSIIYPDGRPRTNDIDFVSFKNNFIELGECKLFVAGKSEMWIDATKFNILKLLANQIKKINR